MPEKRHSPMPANMNYLIAVLILPILVYFYATFAVQYVADDWCDLERVQKDGILGSTHDLYMNWTGRYIYDFAVSASKVLPISLPSGLTLIGFLVALIALFRRRIYLALLFFVTMLTALPTVIQPFYWQSALFNYGVPIVLFTLMLWSILDDRSIVLSGLLAFVITGLSDTMAVAQPVALLFIALLYPAKWRRITVVLTSCIIGLIILLIAPGNAYRAAYFPKPNFMLALQYAIPTVVYPILDIFRTAPIVAASFLLIPFFVAEKAQTHKETRQIKQELLVTMLGILAVNFAVMFAAYYSTSGILALRARSIPIYFTLLGGLLISHHAGRLLWIRPSKYIISVLVTVVSLFCVLRGMTVNQQLWGQNPSISLEGLDTVDSEAFKQCYQQAHVMLFIKANSKALNQLVGTQ